MRINELVLQAWRSSGMELMLGSGLRALYTYAPGLCERSCSMLMRDQSDFCPDQGAIEPFGSIH